MPQAFKPPSPGLAQDLYNIIYTTIQYAVESVMKQDKNRGLIGGRNLAAIIQHAAHDAVDDLIDKEEAGK